MPDGWSSEAVPALLVFALFLVLVAIVFWLGVGRPVVRYLRRTPCPSCGLSVTPSAERCPHCDGPLRIGEAPT